MFKFVSTITAVSANFAKKVCLLSLAIGSTEVDPGFWTSGLGGADAVPF
jgi:hypothetical protein